MSGEVDAAGAMVTAGLVAGAVEGKEPGEAADGACLNCGAHVLGRFCSACGQAALPRRTLLHVLEEFLHGLLHFDTKAWRTLPMVIFRPGTLTRNYVYGKRARYISPLATFLLAIFFMFFAVSFLEAPVELGGTPAEQRAAAVRGMEEAQAAVAEAERELAAAIAAPPPTDGTPAGLEERLARQAVSLARAELSRREMAVARLDAAIARRQREREAQAPAQDAQAPAAEAETLANAESPAAEEGEQSSGIGWNDGETWQEGIARSAREGRITIISGWPEMNARAVRQLENPDLALFKVQEAASKFSFLLVPLSLPFIALLFLWKRGVTMYDHVVYALYALAFASLLFVSVIFAAQSPWTNWMVAWLLLVGLPVHTFFHLGGAYQLKWWSALWRTAFMLTFAIVIASVFVVAIIILGLAS